MKKFVSLALAAALSISVLGCAENKPAPAPVEKPVEVKPVESATPAPAEGAATPAPEEKK